MHWLLILSSLLTLLLLRDAYTLLRNYLSARRIGLPLVVCPINTSNPLWTVFCVPLRPYLERYLPEWLWKGFAPSIYGYEFRELRSKKGERKLGSPGFVLVSAGTNQVWVEEVELAHAIVMRKNDFVQSSAVRTFMGRFGTHVNSENGDDWQRQRKIIAPLINERISEAVWQESCEQAAVMIDHFAAQPKGESNGVVDGVREIAINVLSRVGYGVQQTWGGTERIAQAPHRLTYTDALFALVHYFVPAALVPLSLLTLPVMPAVVKRIGWAVQEFPMYLKDMVQKERELAASTTEPRNNLMSALVRASDLEKNQEAKDSKGSRSLTESEMMGNLYFFTVAGFDTTANTMAYAIVMLAIYPEWQTWLFEELDQVLGDRQKLDYRETFPKLQRYLAFMNETLRLFTPVAHLSRYTETPQHVATPKGEYNIPADFLVHIILQNLNIDKDVWGKDAKEFRPTRWQEETNPDIATQRKAFMPWSAGPRACPGQRMSQVEFISVIMTLFRRHRVEIVQREGESKEQAQQRIIQIVDDSQPQITLQMTRPKDVVLRWVKR